MIIWHATLLHQLKNQLDKSHLHAKIIFVPYQENKNIGHCATLLNYFLTSSTFLPLKILHIWVSVFNTVTLVFSFSKESEAEEIEKNIQVNERGLRTRRITPRSLLILNKWIWIVRLPIRRKNRYESTVFSTIAHSASSSQCSYWTLVLPFSKVI